MAAGKTVEITRGLARNEKDEKRLRAAGVTKPIYRMDRGEELGRFKLRKGESLGVVDGLRVFGETKRDIVWAVKLVHSWDARIIDVETGLCSGKDGAEMVINALAPVRPSEEYRKMQAAAVRERVKGRMSQHDALAIWRNPNLSTKEAISLMPKWSQATAYKQLGKRDAIPGRRPDKRERVPVIESVDDQSLTPPSKRGRRGHIYFVQASSGYVKIGFAVDVKSRLAGLQTSHHVQLKLLHSMPGTTYQERQLHEKYADLRVNGEWFRLAGALKKFLSQAKSVARKGKRVIVTKRKK